MSVATNADEKGVDLPPSGIFLPHSTNLATIDHHDVCLYTCLSIYLSVCLALLSRLRALIDTGWWDQKYHEGDPRPKHCLQQKNTGG
mmetsp:Transcript_35813/g.55101  ORF Transcript_35813/g.55101 Transcript_35813/m.55101 type:complete len:87 (-) Transcript_35813:23-283(-)